MVEAIRQGDIPGVQLRCRQQVPLASREALWRWLTEQRKLETWLADEVVVEGGGPDRLELRTAGDGDPLVERATTTGIARPNLWTLDFERLDAGWADLTQLTLEVRSGRDGCQLSVFHEGFQRLSLSTCLSVWEFYRERWQSALAALEAAVNDGPRRRR